MAAQMRPSLASKMANDEVRGLADRLSEAEDLLKQAEDLLKRLGFPNSKIRKRILEFLKPE